MIDLIVSFLIGFLTAWYIRNNIKTKKEEDKNSIFYKIKQTKKLWEKNKK